MLPLTKTISPPRLALSFRDDLKRQALDKVAALKREGTAGMGEDNLWQMLKPRSDLPGSPKGANAGFQARNEFASVVALSITLKHFTLD